MPLVRRHRVKKSFNNISFNQLVSARNSLSMSAMSRPRVKFTKLYHLNKLYWKRLTVYSRVQIALGPTAFLVQITNFAFVDAGLKNINSFRIGSEMKKASQILYSLEDQDSLFYT